MKYIYLPLIGLSNSGKSTLLNSLIGMKLLPCQMNECTKKGILIKYWDYDTPVLFKTYLEKENETYFFENKFGKENECYIAKGIDQIYKVLEGANGEFINNNEDFFYEINVKIKFFDEIFDDELKKESVSSICLDLEHLLHLI